MCTKQVVTILIIILTLALVDRLVLASEQPEQVSIDSMANLYAGVEFDHTMHTELGEDCSVCHHHTTGTGTINKRCVSCHADSDAVALVGCKDCHVDDPFSAEHINRVAQDVYQFHTDKPGLKAAYHWNCVGCHEAMDGPTACEECHARTPAGDDFYHANVTNSSANEAGAQRQ